MQTERDAALVEGFVRRHYGPRGTLRLHRHALGWDLLRAPVNVALAPLFLLARVLAAALHLLRLRAAGRRLAGLRLQLRSDLGRAVERALLAELVEPRRGGPATATDLRLVADHVAVRTAIAEIGTTLVVVAVGLVVYQSVTPGVISLAPLVTERSAEARELAQFPLGQRLGGVWYGLFPAQRPVWHVVATGLGLAAALSLVTTFAGLVADPVQAALGVHRRRTLRLLARLDQASDRPRVERAFIVARAADLVDAAAALARVLRP